MKHVLFYNVKADLFPMYISFAVIVINFKPYTVLKKTGNECGQFI